jgi:hypothetical protein
MWTTDSHDAPEAREPALEASGGPRHFFRSAVLGWTDPISGARLTLRAEGDLNMLEDLAVLGLEVLSTGSAPEAPQRPRRWQSLCCGDQQSQPAPRRHAGRD